MRRPAHLLAAFAALALALAPALAEARPGGGMSMGSRGGRTYSAPPSTGTAPGTARPMERTMETPRPSTPYANPSPATVRPPFGQPSGGMFRGGFMAGLMGGLIGAGLGGLLFGHGLFGGFSGFASFLGLLLQIGLIVLLVRLVLGWLRSRQSSTASGPAYAGVPGGMARETLDPRNAPGPNYGGGGLGGAPAAAAGTPIQLTREDLDAFEATLRTVNAAWSRQDEQGMRAVATAEMVKYFGDDLAELSRKGLRNETSDLKLEKGDLAEAWHEGNRDYATVAMRFSMIDVTRRISDGTVVEGDPLRRTDATELWTFMRTPGGPWLLSAIQQTS